MIDYSKQADIASAFYGTGEFLKKWADESIDDENDFALFNTLLQPFIKEKTPDFFIMGAGYGRLLSEMIDCYSDSHFTAIEIARNFIILLADLKYSDTLRFSRLRVIMEDMKVFIPSISADRICVVTFQWATLAELGSRTNLERFIKQISSYHSSMILIGDMPYPEAYDSLMKEFSQRYSLDEHEYGLMIVPSQLSEHVVYIPRKELLFKMFSDEGFDTINSVDYCNKVGIKRYYFCAQKQT